MAFFLSWTHLLLLIILRCSEAETVGDLDDGSLDHLNEIPLIFKLEENNSSNSENYPVQIDSHAKQTPSLLSLKFELTRMSKKKLLGTANSTLNGPPVQKIIMNPIHPSKLSLSSAQGVKKYIPPMTCSEICLPEMLTNSQNKMEEENDNCYYFCMPSKMLIQSSDDSQNVKAFSPQKTVRSNNSAIASVSSSSFGISSAAGSSGLTYGKAVANGTRSVSMAEAVSRTILTTKNGLTRSTTTTMVGTVSTSVSKSALGSINSQAISHQVSNSTAISMGNFSLTAISNSSSSAISTDKTMNIVITSGNSTSFGENKNGTVFANASSDAAAPNMPTLPKVNYTLNCACGKQNNRSQSGVTTPWVVSIINWNKRHVCSGSIINNLYVLSTASCVYRYRNGQRKSLLYIKAGSLSNPLYFNVSKIFIHPKFSGTKQKWVYNVALLKLRIPVAFNQNIKPVCLPVMSRSESEVTKVTIIMTKGILTSWVQKKRHNKPDLVQLIRKDVKIMKENSCTIYLKQTETSSYDYSSNNNVSLSPTLENEKLACVTPVGRKKILLGDMGGVLQIFTPGSSLELIGLVSQTNSSSHGVKTITDVSQFIFWILNKTKDARYCKISNTY